MYISRHHDFFTIQWDEPLEEKIQKLQKGIEEHPDFKDQFLHDMASFYFMAQEYEKALEAINQAIECVTIPDNLAEYYCWISIINDALGHRDASLEALKQAVSCCPNDNEVKMKLGDAYIEAEDYKNAAAIYEEAFSNPDEYYFEHGRHVFYDYIECYKNKAENEEDEDEEEDFRDVFAKLLKAAETNRQKGCICQAISYLLYYDDDKTEALNYAHKAKEFLPDEFQVIMRLAEAYWDTQQPDKAIGIYDELKDVAKSHPKGDIIMHWYHDCVGRVLIFQDKLEEAAALYEQDLLTHAQDVRSETLRITLEQLSAIYLHQKKYALAKLHAQHINKLYPDQYPKAYGTIAIFYLEEAEDHENALNYLLKAAQVNYQTPERPEGNDAEQAATLWGSMGIIYRKYHNDEDKANFYMELTLKCKTSKEVDEQICDALYEIYTNNCNHERAGELKERRSGLASLLSIFSGDWVPPPPPDLKYRLSKPKNTKEEIEALPYYYLKMTGENDSLKFKAKLRQDFYDDLINDPAYKEFFSEYEPYSVTGFCQDYAAAKTHLVAMAHYHMEPNVSSHEQILGRATERVLNMILQKKLWNMQLLWRAGKINIPQVQIAYDFKVWSQQIRNCPFIEKVTPQEIEVMKQFLANDNFDGEQESWRLDWQDYEQLMMKDEEDDIVNLPPWYEFYDEKLDTSSLLLLPDIRGQKEKEYEEVYYKWKRKQPPDPVVPRKPEPPYIPHMIPNEETYIKFMEQFENDYICKLKQLKMESEILLDKTYDKYEVRNAIMELEMADYPVYLDNTLNWHQAILKAGQQVKNKRISDHLVRVYEFYSMQYDLGLIPPGDLNKKDTNGKGLREMLMLPILKGRELSGESGDFNC